MSQKRLPFGVVAEGEQLYYRFLQRAEQMSSALGKGEVASAIGMEFPTFSNALRDRNRCHFRGPQICGLILLDEQDLGLGELAAAKEKILMPRRPLTAEERYRRLAERLRRKLGQLGDELIEEALR